MWFLLVNDSREGLAGSSFWSRTSYEVPGICWLGLQISEGLTEAEVPITKMAVSHGWPFDIGHEFGSQLVLQDCLSVSIGWRLPSTRVRNLRENEPGRSNLRSHTGHFCCILLVEAVKKGKKHRQLLDGIMPMSDCNESMWDGMYIGSLVFVKCNLLEFWISGSANSEQPPCSRPPFSCFVWANLSCKITLWPKYYCLHFMQR